MLSNSEPVVRELNTPKEKLEECNKIMNDNRFSPYHKQRATRDILGHTFCVCGNIPSLEVSYRVEGVTKIEHYCSSCWEKSIDRAASEPKIKEEIPAYYGCIKKEEL
jgi:hypothetical protein